MSHKTTQKIIRISYMIHARYITFLMFILLVCSVKADRVSLDVIYDMQLAYMGAGYPFPSEHSYEFESMATQKKLEGFEGELLARNIQKLGLRLTDKSNSVYLAQLLKSENRLVIGTYPTCSLYLGADKVVRTVHSHCDGKHLAFVDECGGVTYIDNLDH